MKKLSSLSFLVLSLVSISVLFFGASMRGQAGPALLLYTRYDEELERSSLYVVNATTGEERKLSALTNTADAGWSPDGRVWLVDSPEERMRRLRFFDAETGAETVFAENLYFDSCQSSLFWSANGAQMAYLSGNPDELVLNFVNLADGSVYQTTVDEYEAPNWSPDANYALISYQYDMAAGRLLSATDGNEIMNVQRFLRFSPDSRYLPYWDESEQLFLYELATGTSLELGNWEYGTWSPSGRYFMMYNYGPSQQLGYFEPQMGNFVSIDLGYPIDFAKWDNDETVLLYSDFSESEERYTRLLSYNLAEASSTTILEDTAWIAQTQQSGDWLAVAYSSLPSEDRYASSDQLLFFNGSERITIELTVGIGWFRSNIAPLANERGFLIRSDTALYHFDNQTAQVEIIDEGSTTMPFWTADGSYLAYLSRNEDDELANLSVWNATSETASIVQQSDGYHIEILGWQGSSLRESLLYCGEG